jgi:hypothetical protein
MLRYLRRRGLPVISSLHAAPPILYGIILSDVLEHLADPRATLRLLRELLVPKWPALCQRVRLWVTKKEGSPKSEAAAATASPRGRALGTPELLLPSVDGRIKLWSRKTLSSLLTEAGS